MTVGPKIAEAMTQRGVIARAMPEGNTIGFAPPLCITPDEITIVAQTLRAAADDVLSQGICSMTSFASLVRQANLIDGAMGGRRQRQDHRRHGSGDGRTIAQVPDAGTSRNTRAIDAAHDAFPAYAGLPLGERVALMRKLHDAIQDNLEGMAQMLTAEQGKPLSESRAEVGSSAAYVLWFAEEARRTNGAIIPSPIAGRKLMTTRHPVGVVAAITPWNFPSSMLARKLGPALAAGCTVVVKPATATPLSGLVWGHLAQECGFPKGVVNVLTGSARAIGGEITSNPKVRKITFTGSTAIGKQLLAQAASTVKRMSMELGGNAPFIVFDDADLDKAVDGAIIAKFRNAGQTCICTNRLFVQAGIYDRFVKAFADRVSSMKVAPGAEDGAEQGPLVDDAALSKIEELVADALSKGGDLVTGGGRHDRGGLFYQPTVIGNASTACA
jgi:succinate-semialdehyde dehydrogenase/glutarate-semialdehyde dehydrogenase